MCPPVTTGWVVRASLRCLTTSLGGPVSGSGMSSRNFSGLSKLKSSNRTRNSPSACSAMFHTHASLKFNRYWTLNNGGRMEYHGPRSEKMGDTALLVGPYIHYDGEGNLYWLHKTSKQVLYTTPDGYVDKVNDHERFGYFIVDGWMKRKRFEI